MTQILTPSFFLKLNQHKKINDFYLMHFLKYTFVHLVNVLLKLKNIENLLKNDVLRSVRLKDIYTMFLLYAFKYVIVKCLILETQHVLNVSLSFLLVNFQINLY
jgi:hypothetical protein